MDDLPLPILLLFFAASVLLMMWMVSCHEQACQTKCSEQYGSAWEARVTETEWDYLCDCIGPEGEIKAPRH